MNQQATMGRSDTQTVSNRHVARLGLIVFLASWLSAGWYHQSRDWNVASRLMLVYSLGDRWSVSLDGFQRQTGDLAFKDGHYYCDKAPGFSLLATPAYIVGKFLFRWPNHPTNQDGFAYWPADAWVTWLSSGLASAMISWMIFQWLVSFQISPRNASICAITILWASPLAVYSTLAYGHQVASALLMGAALISIAKIRAGASQKWPALVGLLAGFGVLTELAQAPVAIAIGLVVLATDFHFRAILQNAIAMILGAMPSALILITYNFIAFGAPLDMGYFHHATQQFAKVHSAENPLGLNAPDLSRLMPLFFGEYRGLLFYAPWVALAPVGWYKMVSQKKWAFLTIALAGFLVPLWVNLSYPEWTGGWSTGPRLLVPALPWLGLASGYAIGSGSNRIRWIAIPCQIWGWLIATGFNGVGGRISQDNLRPVRDALWPLWSGGRLPRFWPGERFARTVPAELANHFFGFNFSDGRLWILLLCVVQVLCVVCILLVTRYKPLNKAETPPE